jgi:uncharacterized protein YkwD
MPSGAFSHGCEGAWIADFRRMPRQRQLLSIATVICVIGVCSLPAHSMGPAKTRPASASAVANEVVDLTNVERTGHGRTALRTSPRLMRAAQIHAEQMARASQLAHVLPGAAYPRTDDRLAAADYRWQAYGENVALGQLNATEVLKSWMHSPGHRTNILNRDFTEMGAGYAIDRAGRPYYVQVFAKPLS